jgi:hypothetical protein
MSLVQLQKNWSPQRPAKTRTFLATILKDKRTLHIYIDSGKRFHIKKSPDSSCIRYLPPLNPYHQNPSFLKRTSLFSPEIDNPQKNDLPIAEMEYSQKNFVRSYMLVITL